MENESQTKELVVRSRIARFTAAKPKPGEKKKPGENELVTLLEQQSNTKPVEISSKKDVMLDAAGRIQKTYRLTTTALSALCGILAPGLGTAVMSLAGARKRQNEYADEEYSMPLAIQTVNNYIQKRFSLLEGKRLVVDERANVIEGVVGPRYKFVQNLKVYEKAKEAAKDMCFHEAVVVGRRMVLRFRGRSHSFALHTPHDKLEPFFPGWHFSNSELGEGCVKSSAFLLRKWTGTASLMPFTGKTKLVHFDGKHFNSKFDKLFELVKEQAESLREIKPFLSILREKKLGFDGTRRNYQVQIERIEKALSKLKAGKHVAKEAIATMLLKGSFQTERLEAPAGQLRLPTASAPVLEGVRHRNLFDLYNALGRAARNVSLDQQEHAEEAAYRLITNPISLNEGRNNDNQ